VVTTKVQTFFCYRIMNFKTLNMKLAMGSHWLSLFDRLCSRKTMWTLISPILIKITLKHSSQKPLKQILL